MREICGYKVRSLTRKEIRELKKYGFHHSVYNPPFKENGIEIDWDKADEGILKAASICVEDWPDDGPNKVLVEVFKRGIIPETYGARDEEKNSPRSGSGSQTQSE